MTKRRYTEEELIALISKKDQAAFAYLYEHYSRALFGAIHQVVRDVAESEDVLQKAFIRIWNHFESYDPAKARLYTWMLTIARRLAIDATRSAHEKHKSKIQDASDFVDRSEGRLAVHDTQHEAIGIRGMMQRLNDDQREIIHLSYFEGYTQEEISQKLSMPLGTVKTRVRQALMQLRELAGIKGKEGST